MGKKVFTTGEVAKLLGININTVIKWFDDGQIKGFRLPISNDRRIPKANLKNFMLEHGIPMDLMEEDGPMRRMYQRVDCNDKISLTIENGVDHGPYEALMTNFSRGGACVRLPGRQSLAIPTSDFKIRLLVTDGPLSGSDFSAKIVHLQTGEDRLMLGLRWDDVESEKFERVTKYLEKSLTN
jgi:excisionase family DNA binding protein